MAQVASYQVALIYVDPSSTVDITGDVFEVSYDRRLGTFKAPLAVGQGSVTLNNLYGRYSPANSSTDLKLYHGLTVRVMGVASGSGGAQTLFTGTLDESDVNPSLSEMAATFRLSDRGKALAVRRIHTQIFSGLCVRSLFVGILDFAGFTTSQVSIGTEIGSDLRRYVTFSREPGLDAMHKMIESGPYTALVSKGGIVTVYPRFFHNSAAAIASYENFLSLNYIANDAEVINRVRATTKRRNRKNNIGEIITFTPIGDGENAISLITSGFLNIEIDYLDEATAQPSWAASKSLVAVRAFTNPDETGTSKTSALSYNVTLYGATAVASIFYGDGTPAYLTQFRVDGDPVVEKSGNRDWSATIVDPNSQNSYGILEHNIDNEALSTIDACQSLASYVVSCYSAPTPQIAAGFRNEYPWVLMHDVGDNIALVHSLTGIDGKFTILSLREQISAGADGWQHNAEYELRKASQV